MMKKLISIFASVAIACLIASPAIAALIVQLQPTSINSVPVNPELTSVIVSLGDVISFQIVGDVTVPGDSGVTSIKGSLTQLLATVTPGTWNTQYMGNLSPVTLTEEFTYGTTSKPGVAGVDVNGDGFDLDVGSSAAVATNYIIAQHTSLVGHGVNGDVLGIFTYTVTAINYESQIPTVLNWKFATAGPPPTKAMWFENGVFKYSAIDPSYAAGTPINLCFIPEPSTLILLGMGALALLYFRRRK
jgi:hypothetical protein